MDNNNTTIRIRELAEKDNTFSAVVSFNSGPEYPITVHDPFTKEQEQELEWYFEEHLQFPFTKKVRASEAAQSITTYGEALFRQVFISQDNPDIYANYRDVLRNGLQNVRIEIVGEPPFHALHWEALKDPQSPQPLSLQAIMVRQNIKPPKGWATMRSSTTINLLIVTARPRGTKDVGYRTISRPLVESLRQTNIPVQIDILRPGTYKELENRLRAVPVGHYHVIHFDVHGAVLSFEQMQQVQEFSRFTYNQRYGRQDIQPYDGFKAFLSLEGAEENKPDLLEASELAALLNVHQVPIAILNACQSGKQVGASETSLGSHLMQAGVQLVLAMGYSVTVSAAELLMQTLYKHLFAKDDLSIAIRHARTELYNHKERRAYFNELIDLEDWLLPVTYQNQSPTLHVREFTPEESKAYHEREAELERTAPPEPTYGFVGRDLDILQIEQRLLLERNILLVRGMGGAGKTTLLRHLGAWWRTTGFVNKVFYFGYNDRAWTRQQIMVEIAQQLLDPVAYVRDFQPLSLDAQQTLLARKLRAEHHLLILDNLESITGANLAIQHTLDQTEQDALHSFVAALKGGHTLVLLGSRSGETWLAKGTFDDTIYNLNGLDPEAASTLADLILKKHHATHYRDNEDLRRLLKLLDGFPLALEVVLPNLTHTTPKEILSALQAGDVQLDIAENKQQGKDIFEQKTESILRCIEYSYSNLAPDAQQLLLCLAPFTSIFNIDWLEVYTARLKQQPALANLPYDRWQHVLQEAANWGLLSPDPDNPHFLHLQPTLPYFLRSRLQVSEQAGLKVAIETAFRELYDNIGNSLTSLLISKEPDERQISQFVTGLEYENLVTALNLGLDAQVSIWDIYRALSKYLDATQDQQRGLTLGQDVLIHLEQYPEDKLAGKSGFEFAGVIDNIAKRQLLLKRYTEAEESYKKTLSILLKNKAYSEDQIKQFSASIYHQLGYVAQEQRQWKQAEQYYQHALQLKIEYNARYEQASTYHQLGIVAQEQRQWGQAEQCYQHALQIYIEYNARFDQALTYHQLGRMAQEQRQWGQAEQCYQHALQIYIEYNARFDQALTYHQLGRMAQ
ncbi:MAG: tetratricopeptide repeat protein, partial [Ktedonobacteraceae bacterium]